MTRVVRAVAPARADLSAGFPDVPPFCDVEPGYVVNVALDLEVEVLLQPGGPAPTGTTLPGRLVAALAGLLDLPPSVGVRVSTPGLTPGSGLGSSGALSVALAAGLLHLVAGPGPSAPGCGSRPLPAERVVELAVRAERDSGVLGGTQDQWASACGGLGLVRQFRDAGSRERLPVPRDLADHLALVHPGGSRDSGRIVGAVAAATPRATVAAINEVALDMRGVLAADDVAAVATLVDRSCTLLAELHEEVVPPDVRRAISTAPGVLGAKPCGAGGGGATWLVLRDPERRAEFERHVLANRMSVVRAAPRAAGVRVDG